MTGPGGRRNPLHPGRGRHSALDRPEGTVVAPDELRVRRQAVITRGSAGDGGGLARLGDQLRRLFERDWLVVGGLLVLAALLRFWNLEARAEFDGDQGHDVLTLRRLVQDGVLPLLGPPTSIGEFHHGAAYYYLLAPVAWLAGADPTGIVAGIATLGVAAVGVTWWFARGVGGRVTAAIAGLLMAVSPAAIEESIFIWNPNPIPLFAALALGCAWRGHLTGRARWWAGAVAAAGIVVQLHVLGIVFLPLILGLGVADVVRARRGAAAEGPVAAAGTIPGILAGLALVALLYVPLALHELQTDFAEARRAIEYFTAEGEGGTDPFMRTAITYFRVVGWPLVGLVTSAPVGAILTVTVATILGAWLVATARGQEGNAARWLGFGVLWSSLALAILAPSLQSIVPGLPNDHYHAFMDPVVLVLVALAARAFAGGATRAAPLADAVRTGAGRRPEVARADVAARGLVTLALAGLVFLQLSLAPLGPDPNGGWPAARDAGARVVAAAPGPFDVRTLPVFKSAEGVGLPILWAGGAATIATDLEGNRAPFVPGTTLVVACDRLFEAVIGAACGGPAEDRFVGRLGLSTGLIERFDLSPRTSVTVYHSVVGGEAP